MAVLSTGSTNFPTTGTFTGLAAAMKEVYGDYVYDQLSQETTLYQLFAEATDTQIHSGRVFVEAIHTARNRSAGPRPESGTALPAAKTQTYNRFEIPIRRYHAAGGFSAQTLLASARDEGSLVRAMDVEVNGAMNDMKLELEVDLFGRPDAALAVVELRDAAAGGNSFINLEPGDNAHEFDGGQADNKNYLAMAGSRFLSKGLELDIGAVNADTGVITYRTSAAVAGNPFVVASNPTSLQGVSIEGDQDASGIVAGDLVMRHRAHGTTSGTDTATNGLYGLEYLIDDGSLLPAYLDKLQGIDRTSDTALQSVVLNKGQGAGAAEAFDEGDIINIVYRIEEASGTYPDLIMTTRPGQKALYDLFSDKVRFMPQEFPGGFKGELLTINVGNKNLPVYVSKHCAYRTLYFINLSKMKRYIQTDFHLAEESGSVLERSSTGDDTWVFRIRWHGNVGTVQPNAHGKIVDMSETQMDQTFGAATPLISF